MFCTPSNPTGILQETDTDGACNVGNVQYWSAPLQFLGNQADKFHGALSFDVQTTGGGAFSQDNVIAKGGGLTLVWANTYPTPTAWTHVVVHFLADEWRIDSLQGLPATASELQSVLTSLDSLYLRAEYGLGVDTGRLDNVVLQAPCAIHNGDMNADGSSDGRDISRFSHAITAVSRDLADTCPGDFDDSGIMDLPDIAGFVSLLLSH